MGELVGIKEYARRRGVSKTAIQKAIKSGRIAGAIVSRDERGHPKIDIELADLEWKRNTDPAQQRETSEVPQPPNPLAGQGRLFEEPRDQKSAEASDRTASAFLKARTSREGFTALRAKLLYRREAGQLLVADEVKAEVFQRAREAREALLNLAARIAPELHAMKTAQEVEQRLELEITLALEALARNARG